MRGARVVAQQVIQHAEELVADVGLRRNSFRALIRTPRVLELLCAEIERAKVGQHIFILVARERLLRRGDCPRQVAREIREAREPERRLPEPRFELRRLSRSGTCRVDKLGISFAAIRLKQRQRQPQQCLAVARALLQKRTEMLRGFLHPPRHPQEMRMCDLRRRRTRCELERAPARERGIVERALRILHPVLLQQRLAEPRVRLRIVCVEPQRRLEARLGAADIELTRGAIEMHATLQVVVLHGRERIVHRPVLGGDRVAERMGDRPHGSLRDFIERPLQPCRRHRFRPDLLARAVPMEIDPHASEPAELADSALDHRVAAQQCRHLVSVHAMDQQVRGRRGEPELLLEPLPQRRREQATRIVLRRQHDHRGLR